MLSKVADGDVAILGLGTLFPELPGVLTNILGGVYVDEVVFRLSSIWFFMPFQFAIYLFHKMTFYFKSLLLYSDQLCSPPAVFLLSQLSFSLIFYFDSF